ncbi:FlgO family outer membrane protein [Stutzerimonas stutzeri]|uniref:FlgO family outer membrane protein n=1 Tax=Stutzerimonas stutzeri TaxID=316 RepID=UPI0015E38F69|nr:FlgO family outer membrane protein [Stutzerimonas stutzeri]MBA1264502.1 hypothetical protein [Stutzerimonas stutzeri]
MKRLVHSLLALLMVVVVSGCVRNAAPNYENARNSPFIRANHQAADALLQQLPGGGSTMIIATLVNIDALERSSTMGRLVSEQVSARFTQAGNRMVEMKFRNSVYISRSQGELMLTREIHELASAHNAQAVIVGSYGESKDYVFINLKVIQPNTNLVLAVHDYALPIDENMRTMLRNKRY